MGAAVHFTHSFIDVDDSSGFQLLHKDGIVSRVKNRSIIHFRFSQGRFRQPPIGNIAEDDREEFVAVELNLRDRSFHGKLLTVSLQAIELDAAFPRDPPHFILLPEMPHGVTMFQPEAFRH